MIGFRQKGDFSKLTGYFEKVREAVKIVNLDKYGREGIAVLSSATPVDTGKTASSWYYKIENKNVRAKLLFCNENVQNGVPIAIIIQYGHATNNGGWVEGRDYINPAIRPIFDQLAINAWREVTKL